MTEWRLYTDVRHELTKGFFETSRWVPPDHQVGHFERTRMVADLIHELKPYSVLDLGCGDGSLLYLIRDIPSWGYDLGTENIAQATARGVDARLGDFLTDSVDYSADLISCTEVVEHLLDPHTFIAGLPGRKLVLSSPSAETGDWHYVDHAWAWDMDGYAQMVTDAGWTVREQRECVGPAFAHLPNDPRPLRFQALYATREGSE